jgi:hypothetical protein
VPAGRDDQLNELDFRDAYLVTRIGMLGARIDVEAEA